MTILFMLLIVGIYLIYKFKQSEEFEDRIFRLELKAFGGDISDTDLSTEEEQKYINQLIGLEKELADLEQELMNTRAELEGKDRNTSVECQAQNCPVCAAISSVPGAK